jgi:hypothetical protein
VIRPTEFWLFFWLIVIAGLLVMIFSRLGDIKFSLGNIEQRLQKRFPTEEEQQNDWLKYGDPRYKKGN